MTGQQAYSYVRFSTPEQKLGESLTRQVKAATEYAEANGLTLDATMKDEGLSGYHGRHVQKDGALGSFLDRVKTGQVTKGSVLIVEHLDRLSRQDPGVAQEQLLGIINRGVDVVTLADGTRYAKGNTTQLFLSLGIMIGNHSQSAVKADRIRNHHKMARGTLKALVPAWIRKDVVRDGKRIVSGRLVVDEEKADIVRRIFRMALTMGIEVIVKTLNEENVPPISERKRTIRTVAVWDKVPVYRLIRGKQVLGLQEIGAYVDGKRHVTGKYVKAYPAIISEEQWQAANDALDGRKHGTATGRNVTTYTNLFGDIARCSLCGGVMKIRGRNRRNGALKYFGCSNAGIGKCTATKYHRLETVEKRVLGVFGGLAYSEPDQKNDPAEAIEKQIRAITAEIAEMQQSLAGMVKTFAKAGAAVQASIQALGEEIDAKQEAKKKLDTDLRKAKANRPGRDQFDALQRFLAGLDGLSGAELVAARGRIANALPGVLNRLVIHPDGKMVATLMTGQEIVLQDGVVGLPRSGAIVVGSGITRPGRGPMPHAVIPHPVPQKVVEAADRQRREIAK